MYNAYKTGLIWHSLPKKIQSYRDIDSTLGHKNMKERLSILVWSNTDGSCHLQPVIIGKRKQPRLLNDLMAKLAVEYHWN